MANLNDFPIGDVVVALQAMPAIEEMLRQRGIGLGDVRFRISGLTTTMSHEDAEKWIRESNEEGYSNIRFILERTSAGTVEVDLAASTPSNAATQFHPD